MSRRTATEIIEQGEYLQDGFEPSSLTIPHLLSVLTFHGISYPSQHNKAKLVQIFNEEIKPNAAKLRLEKQKHANKSPNGKEIRDGLTGSLLQQDDVPSPPTRRSSRRLSRKSSEIQGTSSPLVASTDDSGWEENNVFQSGNESSSPLRPPRASKKGATKSRTDSLAPSKPPKGRFSVPTGPQSTKHESRELTPAQGLHEVALPSSVRLTFGQESVELKPPQQETMEYNDEEVAVFEDENDVDVRFSRKVAALSRDRASQPPPIATTVPIWVRFTLTLGLILALGFLGTYKLESAPLGYCDAGTDTNAIVKQQIALKAVARECRQRLLSQNSTEKDLESCPPLTIIPFPHPIRCTRCPDHATCTPTTVTCRPSYILRPHPLARIPLLSRICNGLPPFSSVAFKPSCILDGLTRKHISLMGRDIEAFLAIKRGDQVCSGNISYASDDGGQARRFGVELLTLKETLRKRSERYRLANNKFDDIFTQSILELEKMELIISSIDASGHKWIASSRQVMNLLCRVRVTIRQTVETYKSYIFGTLFIIAVLFWGKHRMQARARESIRVAELVQVALDALRAQELSHYTDPVSYPQASLPSLHLRDLILQDEHSIPVRRRLWEKVEAIVEGNANVRANMEEMAGGDEGRVWRWVGGAGRERRVLLGNKEGRQPIM